MRHLWLDTFIGVRGRIARCVLRGFELLLYPRPLAGASCSAPADFLSVIFVLAP